jgi:hypothetical protein
MYYIYAFLISIVVFVCLHYLKKTTHEIENPNETFYNVLSFGIIYGITCVIAFFMQDLFIGIGQQNKIANKKKTDHDDDDDDIDNNTDINMLKRIPENIKTGIDPYDSSDDESGISD